MCAHPFRRFALLLALILLLAACGQDAPPDPAPTSTAPPGAPSAVIAVERAVVFPYPDRNTAPLTYVFQREQVTVRGQSADGVFWRVAVGDQDGWILAAQADLAGDQAQLPVIEPDARAPADTPASAATPVEPSPQPSLQPSSQPSATTSMTATPAASQTPRPARAPLVSPTFTPFPPPETLRSEPAGESDAAAGATADETVAAGTITPTARAIWPGTPPPLTLDLPPGWQAAHVLLPFRTLAAIRDVPLSLYEGALPGGATGHLFLFWGFPNVTSPTGEINLWTDGLQILRGSLVDQSCNLGIDLESKTYNVGGHDAIGTLFSAVDCEGEPDTAGYFAALQVEDGNYAFFFAVEPPGAFADQLPTLQAILDSVRFEPASGAGP